MPGVMEGSQVTDSAQQGGGAVLTLPSAKLWPSLFVSLWSWQHWGYNLGPYAC